MKTWVEIIRENVFCLGGNWDQVSTCLCHMLYCIATSKNCNLAFFVAKRMELVTKQARLILPYGILLTRLFKYVMSSSLELSNDRYVLYDRVMFPLAPHYERKTRKDYGTKRGRPSTSASSSSAFDHPSSSHHIDDDSDEMMKVKRSAQNIVKRFVNFLFGLLCDEDHVAFVVDGMWWAKSACILAWEHVVVLAALAGCDETLTCFTGSIVSHPPDGAWTEYVSEGVTS
ncbi:hypothetical protein Tco_1104692 [Tanacetum coccineum]